MENTSAFSRELEWAQRLQRGDTKAYEQLYRDCFPMLAKLVLTNRGGREDAEDVFQEALVALLKMLARENFVLTSKISTLLYSIAKKIWLKKLAKPSEAHVSNEQLLQRFDADEPDELPRKIEEEALHRRIAESLSALSEECRELLQLSFFHQFKQEEIAERMGYSKDFVKLKKHRCLGTLRAKVTANNNND